MKIHEKLIYLELNTRVLTIAYNLENDQEYSKEEAKEELIEISNHLTDLLVNKEG